MYPVVGICSKVSFDLTVNRNVKTFKLEIIMVTFRGASSSISGHLSQNSGHAPLEKTAVGDNTLLHEFPAQYWSRV